MLSSNLWKIADLFNAYSQLALWGAAFLIQLLTLAGLLGYPWNYAIWLALYKYGVPFIWAGYGLVSTYTYYAAHTIEQDTAKSAGDRASASFVKTSVKQSLLKELSFDVVLHMPLLFYSHLFWLSNKSMELSPSELMESTERRINSSDNLWAWEYDPANSAKGLSEEEKQEMKRNK